MCLKNLLQRLQDRASDTPSELMGYRQKISIHAACTPDTSDNSRRTNSITTRENASVEDRWCWPSSGAMNTAEIEMFTVRLRHFTSGVAAGAEALADLLVERDRNADYRRLCVECRHCQAGTHCQQGMAVMSELQRCNQFVCHPALETIRCEGGDDQ